MFTDLSGNFTIFDWLVLFQVLSSIKWFCFKIITKFVFQLIFFFQLNNPVYNKSLDCDWFSTRLFGHVIDAIARVFNYSCSTKPFCKWIPVIGYQRDSRVNYAHFNGFLYNVSYSFEKCYIRVHSNKRSSQETFVILKFVVDTISYCVTIELGGYRARNFKSASR